MIKNYFKTAWRNLVHNKFYSLIHISGLAIGLATAIMLLLWVQGEKSYDRFHHDYRDIYAFSAHFDINGEEQVWPSVPGPLAVYAKSIPEVQSFVRTSYEEGQVMSDVNHQKVLGGNKAVWVDSNFFSFFDFVLKEGNKDNLFPNMNSVVITQSMARKFFDAENGIVGKTLLYYNLNFTVTGVLEDFPENSSLRFDAIFPMSLYAKDFTDNGGNGDWKTIDEDLGNFSFTTYTRLRHNADPAKVAGEFTQAYINARKNKDDQKVSYQLQNLADIHLIGPDGNKAAYRMVQVFLLVAILLLIIASINYINLSTARSLVRAKEVSIRKIVGAGKKQLFFQFILETFLLYCIAIVIALLLVSLLRPLYIMISGKHLAFSLWNPAMWRTIGLVFAGTLVAVSVYPALVLSSFHPLRSLKGRITSGMGAVAFRKILVVFQFTVSVILIIGTLVIGGQMKYIRDMIRTMCLPSLSRVMPLNMWTL